MTTTTFPTPNGLVLLTARDSAEAAKVAKAHESYRAECARLTAAGLSGEAFDAAESAAWDRTVGAYL